MVALGSAKVGGVYIFYTRKECGNARPDTILHILHGVKSLIEVDAYDLGTLYQAIREGSKFLPSDAKDSSRVLQWCNLYQDP